MHELARQSGVNTPALDAIRERLDFPTVQLGGPECDELCSIVSELFARICCECWGHGMGWKIPTYPSPEWDEMQRAWLEDE